jgi:hypothetical protein
MLGRFGSRLQLETDAGFSSGAFSLAMAEPCCGVAVPHRETGWH